ncbi:hypothetical protein Taro_044699 [Colocasia esculenta]|uniref:aralkylamine N-acetyltransferase n=1 Tax=Colocasia esculenta TaxID=4460 RepID=A0A843WPD0_COLES|nr:hypothetical protein [Colocasia esculenta]
MNAARGILSTPTPSSPSPSRQQPPRRLALRAAANFSISDAELESRGFRLRRTPEGLDLEALNTVFARVGFPRRDPARIRRALEHTQSLVWVEDGRSERPVAFARASGDGVFNAVVWDVVVDPSFQGLGLGKAVMERLVDDLRHRGVSNIALYAEPKVIGFYRPLGFAADPDGIRGMVYSPSKQGKGGGRGNFLM